MTATEPLAFIISVIDGGEKYAGEKIITIYCPFCKGTHKHRGAQMTVRTARCDDSKSYRVANWRQP